MMDYDERKKLIIPLLNNHFLSASRNLAKLSNAFDLEQNN